MSDERQIRSFQKVHALELMLHSLGDMRLIRPVPARGVLWLVACEVSAFVLSLFPPFSLLGWTLQFGAIPLSLAWLLTVADIEGRRFHTVLPSLLRTRGRHLAGGHRRLEDPGEHWKPKRVRVTRGRRS